MANGYMSLPTTSRQNFIVGMLVKTDINFEILIDQKMSPYTQVHINKTLCYISHT